MLSLLSALLLCSRYVGLKYGSISRFKGVFSGFWGCCVGLCCLGGLRGLWGFCTRVELGGFGACGVFASIFIFLAFICCSLLLLFIFFVLSFVLSDSVVLLSCLWCLCFLFPLRYIRKKGRKVFLRPLLSCCVCSDSCAVIEKLLRCVFGFFQFVRLIMPTNTASI